MSSTLKLLLRDNSDPNNIYSLEQDSSYAYPSLNCSTIPFGGTTLNQRSFLINLGVLIGTSFSFLVFTILMTVLYAYKYKRDRNEMGKSVELRRMSQSASTLTREEKKKMEDDIAQMYEIIDPEYIAQATANYSAEQEERQEGQMPSREDNYVKTCTTRHKSLEQDADNLLRFIIAGRRDTEDSVVSSESCPPTRSSISNVSEFTIENEDSGKVIVVRHPPMSEILRKKSIQDSPIMTKESFRCIQRYNKRRLGLSFQQNRSQGNSPLPPRKSLPAVTFKS